MASESTGSPKLTGFDGFEPAVGEIRALRTFRVDEYGGLLPLFGQDPWFDGSNHAACAPPTGEVSRGHRAPDPDCECGFYAYGTIAAAQRTRNMRYVQAVVSCWGRVVAGTRGVRSEFARIDALWLAPTVPAWLRQAIARRYPSARLFSDADEMLAEYPLTILDSYDGSVAPRHRVAESFSAMVLAALGTLGLLPAQTLQQHPAIGAAWLTATLAVGVLAAWTLCCGRGPGRTSSALLLGEVLLWLLAPLFGVVGWLFRLPLLALAASGLWAAARGIRPRYFPVVTTPRSRTWING